MIDFNAKTSVFPFCEWRIGLPNAQVSDTTGAK